MDSIWALSVVVSSFACFVRVETAYPACATDAGSETTEVGLEDNVADHVTRLMGLKSSSGSWENTPEVALAVLLAEPEPFTGLRQTLETMEDDLKANSTTTSVGKLAQHGLAAKATCRNLTNFGGVNLPRKLKQSLEKEFTYDGIQHPSPRHGWYGFFLGMGAYCVMQNESPGEFFTHRALHAQNRDGSFDHTHSVDHTAQAMLGLLCLSRTNTLSQTLQRQVETSLNLASTFIMSKVTTERGNVWIADKYSSPTGVLAIKEHSQWRQNSWRCALIMKSLNRAHDPKEGESAIAQRLLALKGKSYLALTDDGYACIEPEISVSETDSSPNEEESETNCEDDGGSNFGLKPTMIDVHISTHPNAYLHDATRPLGSTAFVLTDVRKGKTLLEIMKLAQCRGLLTFKTATTAWGEYITTIDGVEAKNENKEYWAILKNRESLMIGAGQFEPSHSDRISFKLKRWH